MHEYRRRVSQAVDAVENAAMAWDQSAGVLHAEVALHRRHGDVAEEAGNPEDEACERGPAHIHRCEIGAGKRRNESGGGEAADQTLPGLLRADMRRYLVAAQQLAPAILRHVVELRRYHKEEQEPDTACDRVHRIARHEREYRHHQSPGERADG